MTPSASFLTLLLTLLSEGPHYLSQFGSHSKEVPNGLWQFPDPYIFPIHLVPLLNLVMIFIVFLAILAISIAL
jgi:hypothetical protein